MRCDLALAVNGSDCISDMRILEDGWATDPGKECHCIARQIQQYMGKISGPLLYRIDIQVEFPAVHYRDLHSPADGEPSATIRQRVIAARNRQTARFDSSGVHCNARMNNRQIRKHCKVDGASESVLAAAMPKRPRPRQNPQSGPRHR